MNRVQTVTQKHYRVKNPDQDPNWLHKPQTGPASAPGAPRHAQAARPRALTPRVSHAPCLPAARSCRAVPCRSPAPRASARPRAPARPCPACRARPRASARPARPSAHARAVPRAPAPAACAPARLASAQRPAQRPSAQRPAPQPTAVWFPTYCIQKNFFFFFFFFS